MASYALVPPRSEDSEASQWQGLSAGVPSLALVPSRWTRTARSTATGVAPTGDALTGLGSRAGWFVVAKVPHLPWQAAPLLPGFSISPMPLPPLYQHLVAQPQCWFWWTRKAVGHVGTTTTVWCVVCGERWSYGGAVNVKAYMWANAHRCRLRLGPVMGEECDRLFR